MLFPVVGFPTQLPVAEELKFLMVEVAKEKTQTNNPQTQRCNRKHWSHVPSEAPFPEILGNPSTAAELGWSPEEPSSVSWWWISGESWE